MDKSIRLAIGLLALVFVMASSVEVKAAGIGFTPYIGLGIGGMNVKNSGSLGGAGSAIPFKDKIQPYGYVKMGAGLHPNWDVEVRLGSTAENTAIGANVPNSTNVKQSATVLSLFVKPKINLSSKANIHALLGASTATVGGYGIGSPTINTTYNEKTASGFSFGVGFEYKASDHFSIGGDAVRYMHKKTFGPPTGNELTIDGVALSLKYDIF
jgi:opacity protein-like surface antigen